MAVQTVTAAAALPLPKQHHVGVTALHFQYNAGATAIGTAGDVVILGKLPHQATILDMSAMLQAKAADSTLVFFITKGKTASATSTLAVIGTITASTTGGGVVHFRPGVTTELPFVVSLSDDDAIQYAVLKARFAAGTATVSFSINGYITFAMNAEPG